MKKEDRLLKREEFVSVNEKGSTLKGAKIVVRYLENDLKKARIGVTVTKRNGNAIKRNLIKRQIRSIVSGYVTTLSGYDVIIIAKTAYNTDSFNETALELKELLSKIGEK